ncbi:MAG: hypothetical protein ACE5KF_12730, partial [Kiloniellaceae bacterium]
HENQHHIPGRTLMVAGSRFSRVSFANGYTLANADRTLTSRDRFIPETSAMRGVGKAFASVGRPR